MIFFLQCSDKSLRMMSTFCRLLPYLKRFETTLSTSVEKTSKSLASSILSVNKEGTYRLMLDDRFIVRDFTWDDSALEKQRRQLAELEIEEKELRVSIPSFSSPIAPTSSKCRKCHLGPHLTHLDRRLGCYA